MTDYQVIARAVRGPMRRWWQRVGVWWFGFACLALAFSVLEAMTYSLYDYQSPPPGGVLVSFVLDFRLISAFTVPLISVCWLLAVMRIDDAIAGLVRDTPKLQDSTTLLPVRFRLGLRSALWLTIPLAVFWIFQCNNTVSGFYLPSSPLRIWLTILISLGMTFANISAMCLLAGLIVLPRTPRILTWLWWIASFCMISLDDYVSRFDPDLGWCLPWPECGQAGPSDDVAIIFCRLAGLAVVLLVLYLLASNRRQPGLILGWLCGVFAIAGSLNLGAGSWYETSMFALRYSVDSALSYIYGLDLLFNQHPCTVFEATEYFSIPCINLFVVPLIIMIATIFLVPRIITPRYNRSIPPGDPVEGA